MLRLAVALLLAAPLSAFAATCPHEAPRHLQLDLSGVRGVQFEVNSYDLHVDGVPGATQGVLDGHACASDPALLDGLQVSQHREGDQLVVELGSGHSTFSLHLFGSSQTDLDVHVTLPPKLPVTVRVGSGDAWLSGLRQVDATVGSGDLHVAHLAGQLSASVGSGSVDARDIGSLRLGTLGSGDLTVRDIKGDAHVGVVGSGDVTLRNVVGNVRVDTLGSGDLGVHDVAGNFSLGAKGSGDVDHSGVRGEVSLPREDD